MGRYSVVYSFQGFSKPVMTYVANILVFDLPQNGCFLDELHGKSLFRLFPFEYENRWSGDCATDVNGYHLVVCPAP